MKCRLPVFQNTVILAVLIIGCSTEKRDWDKAEKTFTVESYESFLELHPQSVFSDSARMRIDELTAFNRIKKLPFSRGSLFGSTIQWYTEFLKKFPDGRLAETVRKIIETLYFKEATSIPRCRDFLLYYPEGKYTPDVKSLLKKLYDERHPDLKRARTLKVIMDNPIYNDYINKILVYTGFDLVHGTDDAADVVLRFSGKYRPIKKRSNAIVERRRFLDDTTPVRDTWRYSAAKLSRTISLLTDEKVLCQTNLAGLAEPSESIALDAFKYPSSAPYSRALEEGDFQARLFEVFGKFFGYNILINAMEHGDLLDNSYAALCAISGDSALHILVSGPLIDVLQDEDVDVSLSTRNALEEITGEKSISGEHRSLSKKWKIWWKKNKMKYIPK